jgi:hypothetical protein
MAIEEKETTPQGDAPQSEPVVLEIAERKVAKIRSLIDEGKTVLVNRIPVKTIELIKGKKSYYVAINRGQEDELLLYISEFVRRPVEVL